MKLEQIIMWMALAVMVQCVPVSLAAANAGGSTIISTEIVPWTSDSYSVVSAYSSANGVVNQTVTIKEGPLFSVYTGTVPAPITIPSMGWFAPGEITGVGADGSLNTARDNEKWIEVTSASTGPTIPYSTTIPTAEGVGRTQCISSTEMLLYATADAVGFNSFARGYADDPMYFDPGEIDLTITITGIALTSGEYGLGAATGGGMSTDITEFGSLYSYSVYVDNTEDPLSTVSVEFESNPLLGLDDVAIAQAISSSMVFTGGSAIQQSSVVFEFSISSDEIFELSSWQQSWAASTDVPEPGTLALLCLGVFAVYRRK